VPYAKGKKHKVKVKGKAAAIATLHFCLSPFRFFLRNEHTPLEKALFSAKASGVSSKHISETVL
jgi:hypothetical protein